MEPVALPAHAHVHSPHSWVPIRSLTPRHRERIGEHLKALNERDRYLRFGFPAIDEHIDQYVDGFDFDRDELFGIFNRRLKVVAMAHLAHGPNAAGGPRMSEFGVSVLDSVRGRGFGSRLFERALLHASNRGVDTLFIHALSENMPMLRIARKAGASVLRDGPESEAHLAVPTDTFATRMGEILEDEAAEIDYRWKVQARLMREFLETLTGVRTRFKEDAPTPSP